MSLRLDGRAAIVTGAGRPGGIGEAIALRLAEEGADVAVVDICKDGSADWSEKFGQWQDLQAVAAKVQALGRKGVAIKADLLDEDDVKAMVAKAIDAFGRLDILCNNAAGGRGAGPIEAVNVVDIKLEDWRYTVEACLDTAFLCCKHAAPHMIKAKKGSIINTSSVSARRISPGGSGYTAGKLAVVGLTRVLALELAEHGVRVNAIAPGVTDTPWVAQRVDYVSAARGITTEQARAAWHDAVPLKRAAQASEMASVVAFLASDDASYITGQLLGVDGGLAPY